MAPHDKAAEASSSHTTYDQQQEPEDLPPGYEEVAEVSGLNVFTNLYSRCCLGRIPACCVESHGEKIPHMG